MKFADSLLKELEVLEVEEKESLERFIEENPLEFPTLAPEQRKAFIEVSGNWRSEAQKAARRRQYQRRKAREAFAKQEVGLTDGRVLRTKRLSVLAWRVLDTGESLIEGEKENILQKD